MNGGGDEGMGLKGWLKVLAPVLASIGGLTLLRLLGPDFINQKDLTAFLAPMGKWAPVAFVFFLAVRPVTLLPGQVFTAVGGMIFGTLAATIYSLLGSFLATLLIFGLSRWLGTRLMKRMAGSRYPAITRAARRHGFKFALLACINPLLPTDVMIAAATAAKARFWPLAMGVLLGTIPGTFLTAQFGSGLAQGRTVMTVVSGVGMVVSLGLGALLGRRIFREISEDTPADEPEEAGASSRPPRSPPLRTKGQSGIRPALSTVQELPPAGP
ncbi:TVP38/TMEM64 family protein [Archangium violaceum]|uniref:TVP38/TMEM64 family protein n=1 Tax=Archangium violaceum TaxID=83451 RepID=UPI0036DB647F